MKRILISIVALAALCFTAAAQQKGEQSLGLHLGYDTGVTGYKFYLGSVGIVPGKQEIKVKDGHNIAAILFATISVYLQMSLTDSREILILQAPHTR